MKYLIGISAAVNIFLAGTGYVDTNTAFQGFCAGFILILLADFLSYRRSGGASLKDRLPCIAGEVFVFSLMGMAIYHDADLFLEILGNIKAEPIVMAGSVAMSVMMVAINRSGANNVEVEEWEE